MGATREAERPSGRDRGDRDRISYEVAFDPESADEPSITIFETLAMLPDLVDDGERGLVEGIDAEAIDRLFDDRLDREVEIRLAVAGYDVTVVEDGTVRFSHPT
jgi:hypothetical protein